MMMLISSSQSKMPVGQALVEVLPPAAKQTQGAGLPGNVKFWQGKVLQQTEKLNFKVEKLIPKSSKFVLQE